MMNIFYFYFKVYVYLLVLIILRKLFIVGKGVLLFVIFIVKYRFSNLVIVRY